MSTNRHLVILAFVAWHPGFAQLPPFVPVGFEAVDEGYYFLTTQQFSGTNFPNQAFILDGAGHLAYRENRPSVSNFRVWPDGRMSFSSGPVHYLMDSTFQIIDTVQCVNGVSTDAHDLRLLPNGHYLLLGLEDRTMDLSGYFYFNPGNSPGSATATVKCGVIQELDSAKQLVWEWRMGDHFDFLETDTTRLGNPNVVDWSHCNAVELDTDGNILLSSRHFNQITKIDRNADTIIWRLGGVHNEFQFMNDPGFNSQHDIRRLANGNISLYDNSRPWLHPCRGVEYELDEVGRTANAVWSRSYDSLNWSGALGSMQRLENGNSLINWGTIQSVNMTFSLYRPDSTKVCELYYPDTIASYRAFYFPDLPFTIHRPGITCEIQDAEFLLTADPGAASYLWSTGATDQTILVAPGDTVFVEVPIGENGFLRSTPFVPGEQCLSMGTTGEVHGRYSIFPNPAGSYLRVRCGTSDGPLNVRITDLQGVLHYSRTVSTSELSIPISHLATGCYLAHVDQAVMRFVKD